MHKAIALLAAAGCLSLGACAHGSDTNEGAGNPFCAELDELFRAYAAAQDSETATQRQAVVDALVDLHPPDEIADDYTTFVDYLDAAAHGEELSEREEDELRAAARVVDDFAESDCGLTLPDA